MARAGRTAPRPTTEATGLSDVGFRLPWFLPGAAVSFILSLIASGVVGRTLRMPRSLAWALILTLGIILSATLTPLSNALAYGATGSDSCNLSRVSLAPLGDYLGAGDEGGNVLIFIPLGATIALMPRSRRRTAVFLGAILLPFAIETAQLLMPVLDRACESADVVDNLAGLVLGLALGAGAGWLVSARRRGDRPPDGEA
jgi:glycopeptide antibiotics resistance protein